MSLLVIRVKKALIRNPISNNFTNNSQVSATNNNFTSYCVLKIESAKGQTSLQYGYEPTWNQEFLFELASISYDLIIEVWQKGFLFDSIIGMMYVPLKNVRHSSHDNQPGRWHRLYNELDMDSTANRVIGVLNPTNHELLLDTRFELPSELSESEALMLQDKLDLLVEQNANTPAWAVDLYGIAQKRKEDLEKGLPERAYSEMDMGHQYSNRTPNNHHQLNNQEDNSEIGGESFYSEAQVMSSYNYNNNNHNQNNMLNNNNGPNQSNYTSQYTQSNHHKRAQKLSGATNMAHDFSDFEEPISGPAGSLGHNNNHNNRSNNLQDSGHDSNIMNDGMLMPGSHQNIQGVNEQNMNG